LGPRRIFAALALLALAVLTVTAGAAVAGEFSGTGDRHSDSWQEQGDAVNHGNADAGNTGNAPGSVDGVFEHHDEGWHEQGDAAVTDGQGTDDGGANGSDGSDGEVGGTDAGSGSSWGHGSDSGSGGGDVGGEVTGSGAGTPSAPVEAPAVAASGPAPDAATAAPDPGPVTEAFVPAVGITDAPGVAFAVPAGASVAAAALPPSELTGLDELPVLGAIGSVTNRVTDGPSAARALLSTGTGRSLAVIVSLLGAMAVFLAVHRRTDRNDRKLAAARSGPEVARFR
jgi:hypothetical protein